MTFLIIDPAHTDYGTRQVIADTPSQALKIATYRGIADWTIVGTVEEPAPEAAPVYDPDLIGQRDPLEGEA